MMMEMASFLPGWKANNIVVVRRRRGWYYIDSVEALKQVYAQQHAIGIHGWRIWEEVGVSLP